MGSHHHWAHGIAEDLLMIHTAQRNYIARVSEFAAKIASGESGGSYTVDDFLAYAQGFYTLFHVHHSTEENVLFPILKERGQAKLVEELRHQHRELEELALAAEEKLKGLKDSPANPEAFSAFAEATQAMRDKLEEHFGNEECRFTHQYAEEVLDEATVNDAARRMAQHGKSHSKPPEVIIPSILYNLENEQRDVFLKAMPWILTKVVVPLVWKSKWKPLVPFFTYPPG
jgi:hypothetical protein